MLWMFAGIFNNTSKDLRSATRACPNPVVALVPGTRSVAWILVEIASHARSVPSGTAVVGVSAQNAAIPR